MIPGYVAVTNTTVMSRFAVVDTQRDIRRYPYAREVRLVRRSYGPAPTGADRLSARATDRSACISRRFGVALADLRRAIRAHAQRDILRRQHRRSVPGVRGDGDAQRHLCLRSAAPLGWAMHHQSC